MAAAAGHCVFRPFSSRQSRGNAQDVLMLRVRSSVVGCYLISMTLQAIVYPVAVASAWISWPSEKGPWLESRGGMFEDSSLLGLRIQLYAFFGYLLNDLPMSWENSLIRLHHLVCIAGVLVAFHAPEAHVPTALGIFALEYGSLFYNAWLIDETLRDAAVFWWPRSRRVVSGLFRFGMTISNVAASYLLLRVVRTNVTFAHWGFGSFYAVCGAPLLLLRQKEVFCAERPASALVKISSTD